MNDFDLKEPSMGDVQPGFALFLENDKAPIVILTVSPFEEHYVTGKGWVEVTTSEIVEDQLVERRRLVHAYANGQIVTTLWDHPARHPHGQDKLVEHVGAPRRK